MHKLKYLIKRVVYFIKHGKDDYGKLGFTKLRYKGIKVFESTTTTHLFAGDKIISTPQGIYKIRKNGRLVVIINRGKKNEEIVRVTKMES